MSLKSCIYKLNLERKKQIQMKSFLSTIKNIRFADSNNFFLIAGPCVVESEEIVFQTAEHISGLCNKLEIPYIFKASYKKANRSKITSFTGVGDEQALNILQKVSEKYQLPVLTDIHSEHEAVRAAKYVDILQIPAFLARQTDLIIAAAKTGKVINIKKGQFMSALSMKFALDKAYDSGNKKVMLTERGTMFGYQDLIVDFRGITEMKTFDVPIVLDITHSLQKPNQESGISGGQPEMIETIARAGVAIGIDGLFVETHPYPSQAKSDGLNMLSLDKLEGLLERLISIRKVITQL